MRKAVLAGVVAFLAALLVFTLLPIGLALQSLVIALIVFIAVMWSPI